MNQECAIVDDLLSLYVEDMLHEESKAYVREHLDRCPQCRTSLAAFEGEENSLFDEGFAEKLKEAQALTALKRKLHKRILHTVLITAACILLVWVGALWMQTYLNTEPVDLTMQGYVLSADGETLQTLPIGVQGSLYHDPQGKDSLEAEITVPDSFRFHFDGRRTEPYRRISGPDEAGDAFFFATYGYDREKNQPQFFYFALDTDRGFLIMSWQTENAPVSFMVAARESDVVPRQIMEHFSWFVALFQ